MYTNEDLNAAVLAGAITQESADGFRAYVEHTRAMPAVDEEHFRLVTGFNDIFVVIACALLLVSVGWIGSTIVPVLGALLVAASAWGLAEFFVRRRRMALPAIVLLLAFVGSIYAAGMTLLPDGKAGVLIGPALAAIAAWFHWRRFRVPITVAAGVAPLVFLLTSLSAAMLDGQGAVLLPLTFISGVAVFVLAMRWDAQDKSRQTRASDVAFWLHLLAAPLLVHPVFTSLNALSSDADVLRVIVVAILYAFIALVSLAIDRRALMVSALAYVLYAFSALLKNSGFVSLSFAITSLVIGSGLLMLSAFWHPSRVALLNCLPLSLRKRLTDNPMPA
jgi:hypothetical protein